MWLTFNRGLVALLRRFVNDDYSTSIRRATDLAGLFGATEGLEAVLFVCSGVALNNNFSSPQTPLAEACIARLKLQARQSLCSPKREAPIG